MTEPPGSESIALPPAGPAATQAPSTPASAVQPTSGFELPGARDVVARGLQLASDSSGDLRRASLYIGLLLAAVAGPFAVLLLVDIPRMLSLSIANPQEMTRLQATALLGFFGPLYSAGVMAALGFVTVSVDGFLIAVAILAGRAVGRPMRLREALARARQVFWRYGVAAFVVGVISSVITFVVLFLTTGFGGGTSLGASLLASFLASIAAAPFGYVATSIVIGDVTGGAALRRSIVLVRARPRLAVTVAAFAFAASALQTFGLGIATDVVTTVAMVLHPNLDLTGTGLLVAVPLVAVGLVALGSLGVTVAAVTSGPQVAAFLGLTHYAAGLDRARQPEPVAVAGPPSIDSSAVIAAPNPVPWLAPQVRKPARTRWLTFPMAGLIVLESLIVASGIAGAVEAKPVSSDGIVNALAGFDGAGVGTLSGDPVRVSDALGDQAGGSIREADLAAGEVALMPNVPPWLLTAVFGCDQPQVACAVGTQGPGAFDDGALIVLLRVVEPPSDLGTGDVGEWGLLLDLPNQAPAPGGDGSYALASTAIVAGLGPAGPEIHRLVWETGAFRDEPTAARSRWLDDTVLLLVPIRTEVPTSPSAWDGFASVSGSNAVESLVARDWLRPDESGLIPLGTPPTLTFPPG